jgi:hypothetical protein
MRNGRIPGGAGDRALRLYLLPANPVPGKRIPLQSLARKIGFPGLKN